MSRTTINLDEPLLAYLREQGVRESPALAALRELTAQMPTANMQIAPEQGALLALLLRLMGARRCIEVGTFTGYSALACAEALPADGRLVALDISEEWTRIARRFWREAGVTEKIELRLGDAADSLRAMLSAGEAGSHDFMFIDADKTGYRRYAELGLELLRPGGLMAFDNVLWGGSVVDPENDSADTVALREFNRWLRGCERVDIAMLPVGDGLTLARKRD